MGLVNGEYKSIFYVAVMNYRTSNIKMYKLNVDNYLKELCKSDTKESDVTDVDDFIQKWLCENTDYNDSECYYMVSPEPIPILIE